MTEAELKQIEPILAKLQPSDWAWMETNWCNNKEQVFTHICRDSGEMMHVRVNELNKAIANDPTLGSGMVIGLPEDLYKQIVETQGIERDHLDKISPDSAAYEPAIIACLPNGEHIIVDGNHKLVKAYEMGLRRHPAIMVERKDIEPFLLKPPAKIAELLKAATTANIQLGEVFDTVARKAWAE